MQVKFSQSVKPHGTAQNRHSIGVKQNTSRQTWSSAPAAPPAPDAPPAPEALLPAVDEPPCPAMLRRPALPPVPDTVIGMTPASRPCASPPPTAAAVAMPLLASVDGLPLVPLTADAPAEGVVGATAARGPGPAGMGGGPAGAGGSLPQPNGPHGPTSHRQYSHREQNNLVMRTSFVPRVRPPRFRNSQNAGAAQLNARALQLEAKTTAHAAFAPSAPAHGR